LQVLFLVVLGRCSARSEGVYSDDYSDYDGDDQSVELVPAEDENSALQQNDREDKRKENILLHLVTQRVGQNIEKKIKGKIFITSLNMNIF